MLWSRFKMLLIWLEFILHSFILYFMTWKSNEGQSILWNYSIDMWFLHSLCFVIYITVIVCICVFPMARSYILVVPGNPLEIPQSWFIHFPCSEILEKHLIWWKDPRNVLIGCILHIHEHNLPLFVNAAIIDWVTHWYLVL